MRSVAHWTADCVSPLLKLLSKSVGPLPASCTTPTAEQYASRAYRELLETHGLIGSMSRRGNPYDNARIESFFKTLKHEEIFAFDYQTMQDVLERLPFFLEEIYNRRRLHSSLGYMPPHEYETLNSRTAA